MYSQEDSMEFRFEFAKKLVSLSNEFRTYVNIIILPLFYFSMDRINYALWLNGIANTADKKEILLEVLRTIHKLDKNKTMFWLKSVYDAEESQSILTCKLLPETEAKIHLEHWEKNGGKGEIKPLYCINCTDIKCKCSATSCNLLECNCK